MSLLGFQAALSPAAVSTAAYSPAELCLSLLVGWLLGCGITILLLERRARRKRTDSRELSSGSVAADSPEVAPGSDLIKLLAKMQEHRERGDFSQRVEIDLHSDVCQLAAEYNRVLDRA
ncbi:MAG: hypothetical protein K8T25_24250, partial [Planctomycetia bacterium]|nr:hypothetical protein [Planctomycetia bacterium]